MRSYGDFSLKPFIIICYVLTQLSNMLAASILFLFLDRTFFRYVLINLSHLCLCLSPLDSTILSVSILFSVHLMYMYVSLSSIPFFINHSILGMKYVSALYWYIAFYLHCQNSSSHIMAVTGYTNRKYTTHVHRFMKKQTKQKMLFSKICYIFLIPLYAQYSDRPTLSILRFLNVCRAKHL